MNYKTDFKNFICNSLFANYLFYFCKNLKIMKKIILLSMLFLGLISCSNDDSVDQNSILLKRMVQNAKDINDNPQTNTLNITYNGKKILEVNEPNFKIVYTYDGDFITKEVQYDSGNIYITKEYTYENGKLKIFINNTQRNDGFTKTFYTSNNDGTVSYSNKNIVKNTLQEFQGKTGKLYFENGNLVKDVSSNNADGSFPETKIYEYDNKNNFLKNVIGFDKIYEYNKNNILKNGNISYLIENGVTTPITRYYDIYEYSYNENNFPIEIRNIGGGSSQLFYE